MHVSSKVTHRVQLDLFSGKFISDSSLAAQSYLKKTNHYHQCSCTTRGHAASMGVGEQLESLF